MVFFIGIAVNDDSVNMIRHKK